LFFEDPVRFERDSRVGKPFSKELLDLDDTASWAQQTDVTSLRGFVERVAGRPLVAVGVGGSFTSAMLAAKLHEADGNLAVAKTTYDFSTSRARLRESTVIIFTGGGANNDVLGAFEHAIASEPQALLVVCARKNSVIARRASRYWDANIFDFEVPSRRDGFLATNTLFATCSLLIRAFGHAALDVHQEYQYTSDIVSEATKWVREGRETVLGLHGGWGTPPAVDLESKCSEAALRNVLLCDYRHFAHGRHLWLAKRPATSAVIAFITPHEAELAERTLRQLPPDVPVLRLGTQIREPEGSLVLLRQVFALSEAFGHAVGIDPGRPGVPRFGSRVYHLKAFKARRAVDFSEAALRSIGIKRKIAVAGVTPDWIAASDGFIQRLEAQEFSALVFDFDGTLCSSAERKQGLSSALRVSMLRLLRNGVQIGIATGRGKSARIDLQKAIPRKYWDQVLIGYYNGGQIAALSDAPPEATSGISEDVYSLEARLVDLGFGAVSAIEARPDQLTITPNLPAHAPTLASTIQVLLATHFPKLRLVQSSHSLDVLESAASKLRVITALQTRTNSKKGGVLCVGDRGAWSGNDFELLSTPFSLSVDAVSAAPDTCWNFAPAGVRCVQATRFYLAGLKANNSYASYSLRRSSEWYQEQYDE
jgi:HAD superfamily hydrolase (TIGR01484 family)